MTTVEVCPCGQPLHYSDTTTEWTVNEIVDRLGRRMKVTVGERAWMVDRHYIALHGVAASDLLSTLTLWPQIPKSAAEFVGQD